jgi:hypothetical protein
LNSKRVSGFDQAPLQPTMPLMTAGAVPGMTYIYLCIGVATS